MSSPRTRKRTSRASKRSVSRRPRTTIGDLRDLIESQHNIRFERIEKQDELLAKIDETARATAEQVGKNITRLELHGQTLERIEAQTNKTNGRVNQAEKDIVDIRTERKVSKAYVAGAVCVGGFVVTLAGFAVKLWPFHLPH